MALRLPIGSLKTRSVLEPVSRLDPIPTSPLADDIANAPSGPVCTQQTANTINASDNLRIYSANNITSQVLSIFDSWGRLLIVMGKQTFHLTKLGGLMM